MKSFELQGERRFFWTDYNRISQAMKNERRQTKANIRRKKYKEIIAKKKKNKQEKRRINIEGR